MTQKTHRLADPHTSRAAAEPAGSQPGRAQPAAGLAGAIEGSAPMAAQRRRIQGLQGGAAAPAGGPAPVQRMISQIYTNDKGLVRATYDTERPPGIIKDHEGDHTTPFLVLQHEVVNAINDLAPDDAWANLQATYEVYQTLPGWGSSRSKVQKGTSNWGGYEFDVPGMLKKRGNLDALLSTANALLALRNQIDLSAMPGKKKKGVGHGESGLAGGLHDLENTARKYDLDTDLRADAIQNMCMVFDHGRNDGRYDSDLAEATWEQHCRTVVSAYPVLCKQLNIQVGDLLSLRKKYSKLWHETYDG